MKIKYPGPFVADVPALRAVEVSPGDVLDVEDRTVAESLLRQGWTPADEVAEALLVEINAPEPDPEPGPEPGPEPDPEPEAPKGKTKTKEGE